MATDKLRHDLLGWIDRRIHEMLAVPQMWGGCLESVEFQILTLLQVRAAVVDTAREFREPRRVLDEYVKTLAERYHVSPPQPVHQFVGEENEAQFVEMMRFVAAALSDDADLTGDNFFARSYLGLELNFKPGQPVAAQTVTGFYEDFRRATRSLARLGSGRTGRVEKSIEVETDFELEDMEITPRNGVPARARITLGAPRGQKDHVSEGQVKVALGQMFEVVERAGSGSEQGLEHFGSNLEPEARARALVQTLRVLPRRGIEEVRLGGRLVDRQTPVVFRATHDRKVRAALAADMQPSAYENIGSIRAIDLDRGSIIQNRPSGRIQCYLSPERNEAITEVGVLARVVGKLYHPQGGQSFVMIDDISILPHRGRGESSNLGGRARSHGSKPLRSSLRK